MAFAPGFNSRYFVGSMRFSAFAQDFSVTTETAMLDVSTLENASKVFIPGQSGGNASSAMFLDAAYAAQSQFAIVNTWLGTPQPVTLCPRGATLGYECQMVLGNESSATASVAVADAVKMDVQLVCDGGLDFGYVIEAETAITTDTNGAAYDYTAASTNGAVAHLHVTAYSGFTSNTITIEHSTTGVGSWSTIGTFTTVTGVTSQRLVIAGSVSRYLRVVDAKVGTGSCTRIVTFSRR